MPKAKVISYKHKRWKHINWPIVKQIYILKEDEVSFEDLANEFNIARPHLSNIASKENWKLQRKLHWNKVLLRTGEKLTEQQAEIRAKNIMVAEGALSRLANMIKEDRLKGTFGDVDKIVRLIEFLYGNVDSRPDFASGIESLIREMGKNRGKEHRDIMKENGQIIDIVDNKPEDDDKKQ